MSTALLEKLEHEVTELDRDEKVILAQKLLENAMNQEETEQEKAWYDEAERRIAAIESGEMKTYPGPEAIDKLIAGIREK